jgi:hypothetical protein
MGGLGSGNRYHWWRRDKRTVVEDCKNIDANRWTREGILKASVFLAGSWRWTYSNGGGFVIHYQVDTLDLSSPSVFLNYSWVWTSTQQQESASYRVGLTATRPRFGGLRWWFNCPLVVNGRPCNRRAGKLYLPPRGRYFGCRHCHGLTYTSCQESHKFDSLYRQMARNLGEDFLTVKRSMGVLERRRSEPN